ncbi:ABC transporter ATP-binding protein [Paenibacillus turpanensis]|uniref:ABC transporter ATP-binding protein n=1 Tax=Paenibacillus turpanensis TaxID=2689078 RepID=UPI0031333243
MENLAKKRHDQPSKYLFQNVTAKIAAAQRVALLGTSGQGKSTLLRIFGLLDTPDEGDMLLHNSPLAEWKAHEWRQKAAYVAQQSVMLPGTVEENLQTVSRLNGKPFDRELAKRCMASVGLSELSWSKNAADLSGGEKQRTALVRSLLLRPQLLLLDEVTASLDPASKHLVEQCLLEWNRQEGTAYVWVTHDLEQAREISETTWFMDEGTLAEQASTAAFFREPASETGRRFIQNMQFERGATP